MNGNHPKRHLTEGEFLYLMAILRGNLYDAKAGPERELAHAIDRFVMRHPLTKQQNVIEWGSP